jgi:hypothetical protein
MIKFIEFISKLFVAIMVVAIFSLIISLEFSI